MKPKSSIRKIAVAMQREALSKSMIRSVAKKKIICDTVIMIITLL
jgi:hypothetical protein